MYYRAGEHKQHGLAYSPFKALISPRPIGWISSCDEAGIANLAPYSFFNAISEIPPMVMFVSAPDARQPQDDVTIHHAKDSLANIKQTGEFGVNIVSKHQMTQMVQSSAMMTSDEDEFTASGLDKKIAHDISAPLVAGAPAHLECRLHDIISLPGTSHRAGCQMVIGHVISFHIDDDIIKQGKVDVTAFQPVARLGYKDYSTISSVFEIEQGLTS